MPGLPPALRYAQSFKRAAWKIEKILGVIQSKSRFPIISGPKLELQIQSS